MWQGTCGESRGDEISRLVGAGQMRKQQNKQYANGSGNRLWNGGNAVGDGSIGRGFLASVYFDSNNRIRNKMNILKKAYNGAKEALVETGRCIARNGAKLGLAAAGALGLMSSQAHATASAYVTEFSDAATQMTTDITALIPIALGVFAVTFGIIVSKRLFKVVCK